MKLKFIGLLSLVLLAGVLLNACVPVSSAPEAGTTPTGTEPALPPAGSTDTPAPGAGQIQGIVWHDVCAVAGGEGGEPAAPSAGCVEKESAFQANGVFDPGEPGIEGVVVDLGQGACPSKGLATASTNSNGEYAFTGLSAGAYCVSIDPAGGPNESILIPGMWTSISTDMAETPITLNAGETKGDVNFGWDFQFLPVPEGQNPTGAAGGELEPFKAWLSENIASRNYDELQKMMGEEFWFAMWQSEGGPETPENAIRLLKGFFGDNEIEILPPGDPAAVLGFDPLTVISPDVKGPDVLLVRNVGTEGKDGAVLYIAQNPDGSYYWYGLLIVRGGF